jgi:hypothetical protein
LAAALGRCLRVVVVATLVVGLAAPAAAHHSAAPHFDLEKALVLNGVITKFEFVNPHAYVYFDVRGADGTRAPWRCELSAAASLARLGWTLDLLPVGQAITVKGAPARREERVCMLTSFVRADGVEISRNEDVSKLRPAPVAATVRATATSVRPARLADGQVNLKGPWISVTGPGGRGRGRAGGPGAPGRGGPGGPPGRPEPTPAGARASKSYDQRFDDPAITCSPANILFGWTHDQHVNEIIQKGNEITLQYGYMDFVRTVHMNAAHPRTIPPSIAGHSTGTWDGDVLVVDTIGFAPGVLIPISGLMHSAQMHVIERFTVDPVAKTLTRAYRVEDPSYLMAPYSGTDVMRLSDEPPAPYNCVELSGANNVRPQ